MTHKQSNKWLNSYPPLRAIEDPLWQKIADNAQIARLPPDTVVFREGDACDYYLLVVDGSLRVQKTTADGHEIVLYHIRPGETCELTTCCLLCDSTLSAYAITETAATVVRIPKAEFKMALEQTPLFKEFVFKSIDQGLTDLISVIENVAFVPTHQRLAALLLSKMCQQNPILLTHKELANELGTAREVVSRLLKELETHGWVRLRRGYIEVLDASRLREISHPLDM